MVKFVCLMHKIQKQSSNIIEKKKNIQFSEKTIEHSGQNEF